LHYKETTMPMIRGRYYMNPVMGEALEEARARAEEGNAPRGSEEEVAGEGEGSHHTDGRERDAQGKFVAPGPIHHVEIECAEGGYVARVHRHPAPSSAHADAGGPEGHPHERSSLRQVDEARYSGDRHYASQSPARHAHPEVHVFANHNDLADFMREELGKHASSGE
jgi:hypothetical protein